MDENRVMVLLLVVLIMGIVSGYQEGWNRAYDRGLQDGIDTNHSAIVMKNNTAIIDSIIWVDRFGGTIIEVPTNTERVEFRNVYIKTGKYMYIDRNEFEKAKRFVWHE